MRFIIWTDRVLDNVIKAVEEIEPDKDHPQQVEIKPYKKSKTAEQRNWWHKLCGLVGDESGYTKEEIKLILKARVFGVRAVDIAGIELIVPAVHSEDLNRKQYGELIDATYQYAGDAGIVLPLPVDEPK